MCLKGLGTVPRRGIGLWISYCCCCFDYQLGGHVFLGTSDLLPSEQTQALVFSVQVKRRVLHF